MIQYTVITQPHHIIQIKTLPVLLVNARDDPLIWEELLSIPVDYTSESYCLSLCSYNPTLEIMTGQL